MYLLFTYYPRWQRPPEWVAQLAGVFTEHQSSIDSRLGAAVSNVVLRLVCASLIAMGFQTESSKSSEGQLPRPVFFGENGVPTRQYKIDSYHPELRIALEIEAGRAVAGNAIYGGRRLDLPFQGFLLIGY
jgi:hypothetical protein